MCTGSCAFESSPYLTMRPIVSLASHRGQKMVRMAAMRPQIMDRMTQNVK